MALDGRRHRPQNHPVARNEGLYLTSWLADEPQGVLAIVHGYGEHIGRYQDFASWLATHGWTVVAGDLPGHGRSPGRRGHIASFSQYLEAVARLLEAAEDQSPGKPVLLGHSLGGLITARYAELSPDSLAGLILSSPFLGLALPVPAWKRGLARLLSRLWPGFSLPSGIEPRFLSHDPRVVAAYRDDSLVHHVATARWFQETLAAQAAALRDAGSIRVPVLIIQGEEDHLARVSATREFATRCGSEDIILRLYPGLYHELLNELGREAIWAEVLGWLEAHREAGSD